MSLLHHHSLIKGSAWQFVDPWSGIYTGQYEFNNEFFRGIVGGNNPSRGMFYNNDFNDVTIRFSGAKRYTSGFDNSEYVKPEETGDFVIRNTDVGTGFIKENDVNKIASGGWQYEFKIEHVLNSHVKYYRNDILHYTSLTVPSVTQRIIVNDYNGTISAEWIELWYMNL